VKGLDRKLAASDSEEDLRYANSIKQVRNKMREFSYSKLLDALLVYLNAPEDLEDTRTAMQRLPWVAERLAIWLFADRPNFYGTCTPHQQHVRQLVGLAWHFADQSYATDAPIASLSLFVRQAILPQASYQVGINSHSFAMQLSLVKRMPQNSKLRQYLNSAAGMPIDQYFELAVLYWIHSTTARPWFNRAYMIELLPAFDVDSQKLFLNTISKDLSHFQDYCRERKITLDEWFQPAYFYQTPCIVHLDAVVPLGRPALRRFFEGWISDAVEKSERIELRQALDNLIADYVAQSLGRMGIPFLTEDKIASLLPRGNKVVDFLIEDSNALVLIEVKNKSLNAAIPTSRDPKAIAAKLKATVIKAATQLDETRDALNNIPRFSGKPIFQIAVITTDLWIGNAKALLPERAGPDVWLVSLRELDMLVQVMDTKNHTLLDLLMAFQENQRNVATGAYSFGSFLNRYMGNISSLPDHLMTEVDALLDRVRERLPE
jgi:hypothetical protein